MNRGHLLALSAVCVALLWRCSSNNNDQSCPPQCPAGQTCSAATGFRCAAATTCPATGCGANATCRADNVCACSAGSADCDQDLGKPGSNGCECQGGCAGAACAAAGCSAGTPNSCGTSTQYCSAGNCMPCLDGRFNCDGINDCEKAGPCGVSRCSAAKPFDCGTDQYCQSNVCTTCPADRKNCDGVNDCERDGPCTEPEPVPADCDKDCFESLPTDCVLNPAAGNRCEECFTDVHCTSNPRSHGPHCNTDDVAGTGANWCTCLDASECADSTMGKLCLETPTAIPNPAFKQCTCKTDVDCNAPYTICEGGSSGYGRCRKRCQPDDPATADDENTCWWAGMEGVCDPVSGKCTYKH